MSIYDKRTQLIIHRCNDQKSIDRAVAFHNQHADVMMECDVRLTADNIHVAYHNQFYNQRKLLKQEFKDLAGQLISLESILEMASEHQIKLHLDVKVMKKKGVWSAAADPAGLISLLEKYHMVDKVIISNIKGKFLKSMRAVSSTIKLATLYDEDYGYLRPVNKEGVQHFINHILGYHQEINLDAVFFNQYWLRLFDKQFDMLDRVFYILVKAGIKVAIWTVNRKKTAQFFIDRGADWITTDQFDELHGLLINPSQQDAKRYME